MPNSTSGFTGNEIVSRVQNFVGNSSSAFQTYVQQSLPLAEYRFCKAHQWKFLQKNNLSLTITNGNDTYALSVANIGYYMSAQDVLTVFDPTNNVYLKKLDLNQIRRMDPDVNDGSATATPSLWAPVNDNSILLWPPTFVTGTLKIDGKITPSALDNLASFPTIPYRYQESFIEYVTALALDRDNDDRAVGKKQDALALIRLDILDDMGNSASSDADRIKSIFEQENDGGSIDINSILFWSE